MPIIPHEYLWKCHYEVFKAAGVPENEARIVSNHMVKANLVGHDSHGVMYLPRYTKMVEDGLIVAGAPFEVVRETPTTAVINGNWGFGHVVLEKAMRLAIKKAKTSGIAAVTTRYHGHIGRLGGYPEIAAEEDMIVTLVADGGGRGTNVVPYGGRERRLGTNPMSWAIPSNLEGTILVDMATCAAAMGKIAVARARGEKVPLGWIIDKDGNDTSDPNEFFAALPAGAHKGYILSFVNQCVSNILSGMGDCHGSDERWLARHNIPPRHCDACMITVINPDAFYPLEDFKREVTEFANHITSSKPAPGFSKVLYPGEYEWINAQKRRKEGISVPEKTWKEVTDLIVEYKLESVIGKP